MNVKQLNKINDNLSKLCESLCGDIDLDDLETYVKTLIWKFSQTKNKLVIIFSNLRNKFMLQTIQYDATLMPRKITSVSRYQY